jgi:hypothetical protein
MLADSEKGIAIMLANLQSGIALMEEPERIKDLSFR